MSDREAVNEVVTASSWQDGVEVLSDRQLRVTALDHLDGIQPEMLEWWFSHMDAELYFQFHPCDHKKFAWTRGKQPSTHVGATHLTYHQYGGAAQVLRSEISFQPPADHFDTDFFDANDVGFALYATVHMTDEHDNPFPEEAGRFVHVGLRRNYGTEFRSRWWLNVVDPSDQELLGWARLRHVHEEFGFLQGFLRGLYPPA